VGSGPAALYTCQYICKHLAARSVDFSVDIFERLPVPFGLVRYGVAPDHQEVKNVMGTFAETLRHARVSFYGHVNVGVDLRIGELMRAYDRVVLAYGSHAENYLGIEGERHGLENLVSGRDVVSWYNGLPGGASVKLDLSGRRAVIIGAGNVAIDIARLLVSPVDKLAATDISAEALEVALFCSLFSMLCLFVCFLKRVLYYSN
jgi:adrenodoxin-NADP+ reductase